MRHDTDRRVSRSGMLPEKSYILNCSLATFLVLGGQGSISPCGSSCCFAKGRCDSQPVTNFHKEGVQNHFLFGYSWDTGSAEKLGVFHGSHLVGCSFSRS